jgi:hypothetical protein
LTVRLTTANARTPYEELTLETFIKVVAGVIAIIIGAIATAIVSVIFAVGVALILGFTPLVAVAVVFGAVSARTYSGTARDLTGWCVEKIRDVWRSLWDNVLSAES